MKDPYRNIAGKYDRLFDSSNRALKLVGIRMFRPSKGMSILDVGCGTGTTLELYQRFQCNLYGLDLSPAMIKVARARLGETALLELGDATKMPYGDGMFDLVMTMLALHEMSPDTRAGVLEEVKRVLKQDGHILLIDFNPGPYQPLEGWISKVTIFFVELAAGKRHFGNYRRFLAQGGISPLVTQHGLTVEKQQVLAGGAVIILLLSQTKE